MVFPLIIGIALFVADVVIVPYFNDGKDIIETVTGVDLWGPIVDPIVDFIFPDENSGWFDYEYIDEWGNIIIDNQNAWGGALQDLIFVVIIMLVIVCVLVLVTRHRGKR